MKLSIWSSYYIDLSPEDAILEIAKQGYKYTELSDEHGEMLLQRGDPKTVGAQFGAFAREHGVEIPQGHLYLKVRLCGTQEDSAAVLKNWLDLFAAIGIKNAVLHCDSIHPEGLMESEIRERNKAVLAQLVDHLEGKDFTICLENLTNGSGPLSDGNYKYSVHYRVEELLWYIEQLGDEHLGICLDTGHLNLTKACSQGAFIRKAGKHLKALHIADNQGATDQHLMPFGVGKVDFEDVFSALKEIGYDGIYNLEIPGERHAPLEILGYKLQYIKKCMDYLANK